MEVTRDYCRKVHKGSQKTMNPRYYLSFLHNDNDEKKRDEEQPHFVVQMDTESSIIDKKTCLDCNFDKPLLVN